ncbi:DUF664 domain-containing protein [Ornithinimicrobium sp. W1679]|uniref:mycothiol transferase n=1 Tax=Ornithinimicrobium sp. W1679 TaxID=3418770 RepID=UPI003CF40EDF
MAADERAPQPTDGAERDILTGWLAFHRDALAAKCDGLTDGQLVERAAEPSTLSLLGLVRHMAELERAYGVWALGPKADLEWVWGTYENDAEDDIDCDASMVAESLRLWQEEMCKTDDALAAHPTLDQVSDGNGFSVRWNLAKLIGEYARHNGHADLIRERIDGQTGE